MPKSEKISRAERKAARERVHGVRCTRANVQKRLDYLECLDTGTPETCKALYIPHIRATTCNPVRYAKLKRIAERKGW